MALITCPECGKDISDQAKTCPNCGYPFPPKWLARKISKNMKITLSIILAFFLIAITVLFSFILRRKIPSITHIDEGYSISVGMKKDAVDKIITPDPKLNTDSFASYDDYNILISYDRSRVNSISVFTRHFETPRGIHVESTVEDVLSAYGDAEIIDMSKLGLTYSYGDSYERSPVIFYRLDWKGDVCNIPNEKYSIIFYLNESETYVSRISLGLDVIPS